MKTKVVSVGSVKIGGNNPISVQSMCNTKTSDIKATIRQIHELERVGCEIVRVSVPDVKSAEALKVIKKNIKIPLVADIHFDYKLAVMAAPYVDKLRINPGNIGNEDKIKAVVKAAKDCGIPIRIGINLGSLEKSFVRKYGLTPKAMVKSAERHIKILEKHGFYDIIVSLKASDVKNTVKANELFVKKFNYPVHLGVTEAGGCFTGNIKTAAAFGILLSKGIGNTVRVSLSSDPVDEVKAGYEILKSLGLRKNGVMIISCPTCARHGIDVVGISKKLESLNIRKPLKIAVMGCIVNGPGEAKKADLALVGSDKFILMYKKGRIIKKVEKTIARARKYKIVDDLIKEVRRF